MLAVFLNRQEIPPTMAFQKAPMMLATLAACASLFITPFAPAQESSRKVQLAGRTLQVPTRYFDPNQSPLMQWLQSIVGLDDGARDLNLRIPAAEVADSVAGYKPAMDKYADDLRLLVVALSVDEQARYARAERLLEIWNGAGSWREKIVERDQNGLVRVYRKIEYPRVWETFTAIPSEFRASQVLSVWIGNCLTSSSPLTVEPLALCKSDVVSGDIAIHYTTSFQNLEHTTAIRRFLLAQLARWLSQSR